MTLSQCIDRLVKKHGGVRALARAAGIDAGYVTRLRNGDKSEPSDTMLAALGLERVVTYKVSRTPNRASGA
jgi:transcriptional regulator with XRE-family HTH domain